MLAVTYTLTPFRCAILTASFNSSLSKFVAPALALNNLPPKYTASAPFSIAACKDSILPTGASNSILFFTLFFSLLKHISFFI